MAGSTRWLRFWGDTMEGRRRGEAYAAYCPEGWDTRSRVGDPHPGLLVVVHIEEVLRELDGPMQGQFFNFAIHRYVDRKPASAFPDGRKIEQMLLNRLGASVEEMDIREWTRALAEIRREGIRRRREYLAKWIANSRETKSSAIAA